MKALRFDHISLHVHDLAASARFYAEVLGLPEIENKTYRSDIRWFGFDGHRAVHLISGGVDPPPERPLSSHYALASDAFDDAVAFLKSRKIEFVNSKGKAGEIGFRADGVRQIYFRDPDNYWIEINEAQD
ncbi:MAG TPA: VOC family protein [Roseiarcus sp.]|nr:VOC family protein [Roseiarcus sp.]